MSEPIDFIVTTRNRALHLNLALKSFFATVPPERINQLIIVDDGSTDETKGLIKVWARQHKFITLCKGDERRGLIPRFNQSFLKTTANVVCEFQDDVMFEPGWLDMQLEALPLCDFVTGFDAPEHRRFGSVNGLSVKHSSRFTQLMALRSTWTRWFPMAPKHPFPTPTVHEGRNIGSGIDTALSGGISNPRRGKTKFICVPSVHHTAERVGDSTWRNDDRIVLCKEGGLPPKEVMQYWAERFKRENDIAVGYAAKPREEQAKILASKQQFLQASGLDVSLATLDYGCGTGEMTRLFRAPVGYFGVDITAPFVKCAKERHPSYLFRLLRSPRLPRKFTNEFEQVFTSNVLQHNSDKAVDGILRSIAAVKPSGFKFALYENTHKSPDTEHMRFRSVTDYVLMISKHFEIDEFFTCHSHMVHNQEHSLIQVTV